MHENSRKIVLVGVLPNISRGYFVDEAVEDALKAVKETGSREVGLPIHPETFESYGRLYDTVERKFRASADREGPDKKKFAHKLLRERLRRTTDVPPPVARVGSERAISRVDAVANQIVDSMADQHFFWYSVYSGIRRQNIAVVPLLDAGTDPQEALDRRLELASKSIPSIIDSKQKGDYIKAHMDALEPEHRKLADKIEAKGVKVAVLGDRDFIGVSENLRKKGCNVDVIGKRAGAVARQMPKDYYPGWHPQHEGGKVKKERKPRKPRRRR